MRCSTIWEPTSDNFRSLSTDVSRKIRIQLTLSLSHSGCYLLHIGGELVHRPGQFLRASSLRGCLPERNLAAHFIEDHRVTREDSDLLRQLLGNRHLKLLGHLILLQSNTSLLQGNLRLAGDCKA